MLRQGDGGESCAQSAEHMCAVSLAIRISLARRWTMPSCPLAVLWGIMQRGVYERCATMAQIVCGAVGSGPPRRLLGSATIKIGRDRQHAWLVNAEG